MTSTLPPHRLSIAERCANLAPTPAQVRPLELGVLAECGPGAIKPARRRHFALLHQYAQEYDPTYARNDGAWRAELVRSLLHVGILCKFLTTVVTHQLSELHTHLDTIYEEHAFLMSQWADRMAPFWTVRRAVFDAVLWDSHKWSPSLLLTELAMQRRSQRRRLEDVPRGALALAEAMGDLMAPTAALSYDMLACVGRPKKEEGKKGAEAASRCNKCIGCVTKEANKACIAWRSMASDVYHRAVEAQVRSTARLASQMALQAARVDIAHNRSRGGRRATETGKGSTSGAFRVRMLGDRKYAHPDDGVLYADEEISRPILRHEVYSALMVMGATLSAPDLEWTSEPSLPVKERFWCVMTGDPIESPADGFYWIYTVPGAAPVVLTVSRAFLETRETRMQMLEWGASFEQIAHAAPLRGVELALFLATPPPAAATLPGAPQCATLSELQAIDTSPSPLPQMSSFDAQMQAVQRALAQKHAEAQKKGLAGTPVSAVPTPIATSTASAPVEVRTRTSLTLSSGTIAPRPSAKSAGGSSLLIPPPPPPSPSNPSRVEPGQRANPPRQARTAALEAATAKASAMPKNMARHAILADVLQLMMQANRRQMQNLRYMARKLEEPGYEVTDEMSDEEDEEDGEAADEEERLQEAMEKKRKLARKQEKKRPPKAPKEEEEASEDVGDVGDLGEDKGDGEADDGSEVENPNTLTGMHERSEDNSQEAAEAASGEDSYDSYLAKFGTKKQQALMKQKKRKREEEEEEKEEDEEEEEDESFEGGSDDADESESDSGSGSDEEVKAEEATSPPKKKLRKVESSEAAATTEDSSVGFYYTPFSMTTLPENWVCIPAGSSASNLLSAIVLEMAHCGANIASIDPTQAAFWREVVQKGKLALEWVSSGGELDLPLVQYLSVMRELFFVQDTFKTTTATMPRFAKTKSWTEHTDMEDWKAAWEPNGTEWGPHVLNLLATRAPCAEELRPFLAKGASVAACRKQLYTLLSTSAVALIVASIKKRSQ